MERNVMATTFTKKNIGTLFLDNPIVLRDLRATMRGTRAFWVQGIYLLLLGIIAITGYATATGQSLLHSTNSGPLVFDVVDAQLRLQNFYYFIFVTLAALITLIAPALTATSVSDERQRQSLDLLVTTPLSAAEMLAGKLMSSLAFLGLLLVLSLPASVLCILLGGATIGDVFRIYFMLGVDAIVLASIGLYFSCACKNSLQSLIWTYGSVAMFTGLLYAFGTGINTPFRGWPIDPAQAAHASGPLVNAIIALSPFSTMMQGATQTVGLGPVTLPTWLAMIPVAFVAVRLLLTAAAYRFGVFGGTLAQSLRKQVLGATAFAAFAVAYTVMHPRTGFPSAMSGTSDTTLYRDSMMLLWFFFTGLFFLALPFLPGLFVPVRSEDAPPGEAQEVHNERDNGLFRVQNLLRPQHSGALPYFLAWMLAGTAGALGGFATSGGWNKYLPEVTGILLLFVTGAGVLVWGLSRVAAQWTRSASTSRALSFGLFALTIFIPAFVLTIISMNVSQLKDAQESLYPFWLWLGGPYMVSSTGMFADYALNQNTTDIIWQPLLVSGTAALVTGLVLGALAKPKKV